MLALGIGGRFLYLYNLDYTTDVYDDKAEGYEFNEPLFLQSEYAVPALSNTVKTDKGVWVNSEYAENPKSNLRLQLLQESKAVLSNGRPVFYLINLDEKQTQYRIIADLSGVRNVKEVTFPTWGEKNGAADIQPYQGTYDPQTNTWQSDILVKNHKESGRYQTKMIVTKNSGKVEEVAFDAFKVNKPKVAATVDAAAVNKGQFDVDIQVDSIADVEKVSVPVWSKEDKSDLKHYTAQRQPDGTYKAHMDYEDFHFANGTYKASVKLTGVNGLTAKNDAGTAEINLSHPVRIRILGDTSLFKDRSLTNVTKTLATNSVSYIKGVVYNGNQKVYKTHEGYILAENLSVNEMSEDIRYVAHRGNHDQAPENSLPAFYQTNSWGVETDIHPTKDGHWVIMHDGTVDRMTNGTGNISDLTLDQIRQLRIDTGTNFSAYSADQLVVPTLEEYLTIMQSTQAMPLIEVKPQFVSPENYDTLVNLLNQYGFADRAMVISFEYNNLVEMKKRMPNLHVQLLSNGIDEQLIANAKNLGSNSGLDVNFKQVQNSIDLIARSQAEGLSINMWNVPKSKFKKAKTFGVDFLTSDPS